jgi:integrase
VFGAYSGLRPSELTALRVARLDLLRGTVRVVEAATEVDGHLHWGPVKTHEARTVRIPRSICEELGTQLAGRPHGRDDLAFPAPLGGPMRWGKWTRRYFKPAAVRAGLFVTREVDPKTGQVVVSSALRLYDLRHTCASLLIAQGAVSRRSRRSSATQRPASPWTPMGTCSLPSWRPWPTGWSRSERPPWRAGSGPSADQPS